MRQLNLRLPKLRYNLFRSVPFLRHSNLLLNDPKLTLLLDQFQGVRSFDRRTLSRPREHSEKAGENLRSVTPDILTSIYPISSAGGRPCGATIFKSASSRKYFY